MEQAEHHRSNVCSAALKGIQASPLSVTPPV